MRRLVIPMVLLGFLVWSCSSTPAGTGAPEKVRAPRVIQRVTPEYPEELRREHVVGLVVIAGTVPKEGGRLVDPHVVRASDPRLSEYALKAVAQWIWQPGLQDGQPVDVQFETTVSFSAD